MGGLAAMNGQEIFTAISSIVHRMLIKKTNLSLSLSQNAFIVEAYSDERPGFEVPGVVEAEGEGDTNAPLPGLDGIIEHVQERLDLAVLEEVRVIELGLRCAVLYHPEKMRQHRLQDSRHLVAESRAKEVTSTRGQQVSDSKANESAAPPGRQYRRTA